MKFLAYAAVAASVAITPVMASAEAGPTVGTEQSNAATQLFTTMCIDAAGNFAKLSKLATQHHLPTVDGELARLALNGHPGRVWNASAPFGQFMVIGTSDDNACQVWARRADGGASLQQFIRVLSGVPRPGLTVRLVSDRQIHGDDGDYRQVAYMMKRDGAPSGMLASLLATESDKAAVQLRLRLQAALDK